MIEKGLALVAAICVFASVPSQAARNSQPPVVTPNFPGGPSIVGGGSSPDPWGVKSLPPPLPTVFSSRETGGTDEFGDVLIRSDGTAVFAFLRGEAAATELFTAEFDGVQWGTPQQVSRDFQRDQSPRLGATDNGRETIIWWADDGLSSICKTARREKAGVWGEPRRLSSFGDNATYPEFVAIQESLSPVLVTYVRETSIGFEVVLVAYQPGEGTGERWLVQASTPILRKVTAEISQARLQLTRMIQRSGQ